jgi:hypothetical protein
MFGDARRAVIVGGLVIFATGFLLGLVVGRSGGDDDVLVAVPSPTTSVPSAVATPSQPVVTPTPGRDPAIGTQGAVLVEGDRPVVLAAATAPCQSLVTPASLGECGEVSVGGSRVVWVAERTATATGATARTVRIFTFVPDAGGWVEWLRAADATGERWSDVTVLAQDLTADGVSEIVVGFRGTDGFLTLSYDIVGYDQDDLPVVLAHPDDVARGVVVVSGGAIDEYEAQYPNAEPACCPASYVRRSIAFEDGFFRVVATETLQPNAVPASQL